MSNLSCCPEGMPSAEAPMHLFGTGIGPHYTSARSQAQYRIQMSFGNDLKAPKGQNSKARGNAPGL